MLLSLNIMFSLDVIYSFLQQRHVAFLHLSLHELPLQLAMGCTGLAYDEQSAGGLVKAMNDERRIAVRISVAHDAPH